MMDLNKFTPTSENINALPESLRVYIHDLETNCDPGGLVQENAALRDQNEELVKLVQGLRKECFREELTHGRMYRNHPGQ